MGRYSRLIIRRLTALKPTDIIRGSVADNSRGTSTWFDLINLTTDPLIIRGFIGAKELIRMG